jgi:ABC-type oligopeptide transport system substrate-binding subunit
VELALIEDGSAALAAYEDDRLDILALFHLPPSDMDRARQRHAGEYLTFPFPLTFYVGFRISCPPFDDVRVRQAFGLAIDKETLANIVLRGRNFPATGGLVPPGIPGHSSGIGLPYDPAKARELLAEAGYPGGRGFPAVDAFRPFFLVPHSDYVRSLWRDNLGVEIAWQDVDIETLDDAIVGEQPMLFAFGWVANFHDPDYVLRVGVREYQPGWRDEAYDDLIERARRVPDQAQRLKLYGKADRILMKASVMIPIAYARGHLLVKPWVKRYPVAPSREWFWKDVIIEPH